MFHVLYEILRHSTTFYIYLRLAIEILFDFAFLYLILCIGPVQSLYGRTRICAVDNQKLILEYNI